MKQYKHPAGSTIYTEVFSDDAGSLLSWPTIDGSNRAWVQKSIMASYVEYKEPVIEIRYGRTLNICNCPTYWSLEKFPKSNLKATFTDGKLTAVDII